MPRQRTCFNVAENECVHKLRDFNKELYWNQIPFIRVRPQINDFFHDRLEHFRTTQFI
jgi:hypothetical protein